MSFLLQRLRAFPIVTLEMLIASLFANILALASPLFVIQVLNRYVSHGIDGTLITLTTGVLIAIMFEFLFREIRQKLAAAVAAPFDQKLADDTFQVLTGAKAGTLERIPPGLQRETVAGVDMVQQAYAAPNITALLDIPYALVFIIALGLLSPWLALIVVFFFIMITAVALMNMSSLKKPSGELQEFQTKRQTLLGSSIAGYNTIRAFNASNLLRNRWKDVGSGFARLKEHVALRQGRMQNITQSAQALQGTFIIAIGATLVVKGGLDMGALIGANIIAGRALGPLIRVAQLTDAFAKARQAMTKIEEFTRLPLERSQGSALKSYSGKIEFKDLGFLYPGTSAPLFESLSFRMEPGASLLVTGANATGKSTFSRLLVGLLEPSRGQILVDGLNLAQVAPEWWRRQVMYLPQEPSFIPGTIRENVTAYNPELNNVSLNRILRESGLEEFISESADGLDTQITTDASNLSLGIRRRLALARALACDGKLLILDEPTEGMDNAGALLIANLLQRAANEGRTVVLLSHDPNIVQGAPFILDLNSKPIPQLLQVDNDEKAVENEKTGITRTDIPPPTGLQNFPQGYAPPRGPRSAPPAQSGGVK